MYGLYDILFKKNNEKTHTKQPHTHTQTQTNQDKQKTSKTNQTKRKQNQRNLGKTHLFQWFIDSITNEKKTAHHWATATSSDSCTRLGVVRCWVMSGWDVGTCERAPNTFATMWFFGLHGTTSWFRFCLRYFLVVTFPKFSFQKNFSSVISNSGRNGETTY